MITYEYIDLFSYLASGYIYCLKAQLPIWQPGHPKPFAPTVARSAVGLRMSGAGKEPVPTDCSLASLGVLLDRLGIHKEVHRTDKGEPLKFRGLPLVKPR